MNAAIGPLAYKQDEQSFQKPFSEKTAELLDFEVRKMVNQAHKRTTQLLMDKREEVKKVAELLLAKEVLNRYGFFLSCFWSLCSQLPLSLLTSLHLT